VDALIKLSNKFQKLLMKKSDNKEPTLGETK